MSAEGQHNATVPHLYLCGIPGRVGGAATKITLLIRLLHRDFRITVVPPELWACKDTGVKQILAPYGIPCVQAKDLPKRLEGIVLGVCDGKFFVSGRAQDFKERGLRLVWSNEMMFPFDGEAEAAKKRLCSFPNFRRRPWAHSTRARSRL